MPRSNKPLTPQLALQKMMSWCAYQERSHDEALRKMGDLGLSQEEADNLLATLISENYLNEERFALAFAGGKFRMKRWGRNKIRAGLKSYKVPDYCIKKALLTIDAEEYENTIIATIEKKLRTIEGDSQKQFYSTLNYMMGRGFEGDLVAQHLNHILHSK